MSRYVDSSLDNRDNFDLDDISMSDIVNDDSQESEPEDLNGLRDDPDVKKQLSVNG